MTTDNNKKRYICSFVKEIDGKLVPNVVVIVAPNNIVAKAVLCNKYIVKNVQISKEHLRLNRE